MLEHRRYFLQTLTACVMVASVAALTAQAQEAGPPVEAFLLDGKLADGAAAMRRAIETNGDDQQARFSLGLVQFLQAIEGLGQDHYRYGLLAGRAAAVPMMRLPVAANPAPEEISYAAARNIVQSFVDRLKIAEATLAEVQTGDLRLPIRIGAIRLDLNGDGKLTDQESLWYIVQALQTRGRNAATTPVQDFPIVLDAGDVPWLRGYCHALSAVAEVVLAHDWSDQFARTAHLFYPKVDSTYEYFEAEGPGALMGFGTQNILDIVALLHTINYEVAEPARMLKALTHMEIVIKLSRESWQLIESETDDESEWVPNANQTSVMKGFTVGRETIAGWHDFLDEMEAILQGKTLVPFWRGIQGGQPLSPRLNTHPTLGINVRRIFTQPTRFDLALWLQGSGLQPYLEEGEITSPEKWTKMMRSFQGNFVNFFFWFN